MSIQMDKNTVYKELHTKPKQYADVWSFIAMLYDPKSRERTADDDNLNKLQVKLVERKKSIIDLPPCMLPPII